MSKVWYRFGSSKHIEVQSRSSVSKEYPWDSVEEFFDNADWLDCGDVVRLDRCIELAPVWAVLIPTAFNEDGNVLNYETRTFDTEEEATRAYAEAMKEHDQ